MVRKIPGGVYPVMITPYTDDNKIDYNAVEQLLHWYARKGCSGVFAACQSSEIFCLTAAERLELVDFIMKHRPDGMAVVASGHVADDLDTQIEEAKRIIDTGIDAYVYISNRFAKKEESDEVMIANMRRVTDALPDIALGVYECPYPYNRLLTDKVLDFMIEDGRFAFIKDTCCSPALIRHRAEYAGERVGFFNANAATALMSMDAGYVGFSGIMANFYPELIVEMLRCRETDHDRAQAIQDFVGFCSAAEGMAYNMNSKYLLKKEGLDITTHTRSGDEKRFDEMARIFADELYGMTQTFKAHFGIQ